MAQGTISAPQAMARARAMIGTPSPCRRAAVPANTVVVCARDHDRDGLYRGPEEIRNEPKPRGAGAATAWGTRNLDAEDAALAGRPNGSSPDGAGGQSGLTQKIRREWERERQAIDARQPE
ncbi:hypothetical protein [Sphingomonas sp.]|jgi:hypothetical protein|uniref:hypothetical protein n=1 Tax=Sphingomonas sp. TaxID=28214 RepID=UPI002ED9AE0B